jgi:hypothetical protein
MGYERFKQKILLLPLPAVWSRRGTGGIGRFGEAGGTSL